MMSTLAKLKVSGETPIIEVMKLLENCNEKIALVVDSNQRLIGTVTDGDVRRGIIRNVSVQDVVLKIMNSTPVIGRRESQMADLTALMALKQINQLPIVDDDGRLVDLITQNVVAGRRSNHNPVVVMAGGLGSRLEELTANCPKPMLKVGDKPLLQTILENLIDQGFHDFHFSVNYRSEMIESHFGDGKKWDVSIRYLREKEKMGTAGSLSLLSADSDHPIVVVNGDVLTKVNFSHLIDNHIKYRYAASMCVRKYEFQVPFGVVETNGPLIKTIHEKPVESFFVNAGIYVLNPEVVAMVPKEGSFDMPLLFNRLASDSSLTAGVFPIHEYWLDVGRRDDFDRAQLEFHKVF